jgi:hypothetical protein
VIAGAMEDEGMVAAAPGVAGRAVPKGQGLCKTLLLLLLDAIVVAVTAWGPAPRPPGGTAPLVLPGSCCTGGRWLDVAALGTPRPAGPVDGARCVDVGCGPAGAVHAVRALPWARCMVGAGGPKADGAVPGARGEVELPMAGASVGGSEVGAGASLRG